MWHLRMWFSAEHGGGLIVLKVISDPKDSISLPRCVNPILQQFGRLLELTGVSGLDWPYRLGHTLVCSP